MTKYNRVSYVKTVQRGTQPDKNGFLPGQLVRFDTRYRINHLGYYQKAALYGRAEVRDAEGFRYHPFVKNIRACRPIDNTP